MRERPNPNSPSSFQVFHPHFTLDVMAQLAAKGHIGGLPSRPPSVSNYLNRACNDNDRTPFMSSQWSWMGGSELWDIRISGMALDGSL